ncbi:MAG: hypothetical protein A3A97_02045 [Candidatus Terrybacteria bacterium RIFCSPLOWO2_01_FULL_40_23]|uniref:N-acetyltransferase domain-containing protein n=1 Tax=Candidatus Terrybacteria bacterium RIFCSPLOWO2_01_FULL_40_23 TaxID=1802366 RepID=A0A1G2PQV5_9BACT|nr:MAG: hypothetical protein A3A97_02045 [Candidatus Terrybacteria bacterium RIFCSPLOWO2_01_FULL_40_23]
MDKREVVKNRKISSIQFANLRITVGWNSYSEKLETALQNSYCQYSIVEEDRLIGFVRVISDHSLHAYIADLMVDPRYQKQGLGRLLLSRAVEDLKRENFPFIELIYNPELETFYKKLGFEIIGAGIIRNGKNQ